MEIFLSLLASEETEAQRASKGWNWSLTQRYLATKSLTCASTPRYSITPRRPNWAACKLSVVYTGWERKPWGRGQILKGGSFYTTLHSLSNSHPWIGRYRNPISPGLALGCWELFIELGTIRAEGAPRFFIKVFAEALSDLQEIKVPVVFS